MSNTIAKELQILIEDLQELNTHLGNKAAAAIRKMGHSYNWTGITKKPWTNKDVNFLMDNYGKMPNKRIAQALDRTRESVCKKYREVRDAQSKTAV